MLDMRTDTLALLHVGWIVWSCERCRRAYETGGRVTACAWLSGRLTANEALRTPLNILLIVTYDLLWDFLHSNTANG